MSGPPAPRELLCNSGPAETTQKQPKEIHVGDYIPDDRILVGASEFPCYRRFYRQVAEENRSGGFLEFSRRKLPSEKVPLVKPHIYLTR